MDDTSRGKLCPLFLILLLRLLGIAQLFSRPSAELPPTNFPFLNLHSTRLDHDQAPLSELPTPQAQPYGPSSMVCSSVLPSVRYCAACHPVLGFGKRNSSFFFPSYSQATAQIFLKLRNRDALPTAHKTMDCSIFLFFVSPWKCGGQYFGRWNQPCSSISVMAPILFPLWSLNLLVRTVRKPCAHLV